MCKWLYESQSSFFGQGRVKLDAAKYTSDFDQNLLETAEVKLSGCEESQGFMSVWQRVDAQVSLQFIYCVFTFIFNLF